MKWKSVCVLGALIGCVGGPAEPDSPGIQEIERINQGALGKRVAHFKGPDAMLFIALDPVWSTPDFDNVPFRHPTDMKMIRRQYDQLLRSNIDEVVVWELRRGGLGTAVPFSKGKSVEGYGEPDHLSKLKIMRDTVRLINRKGIDDPSVRNALMKLLKSGRFGSSYEDSMIDIMIRRIRPVIAKAKSPPGGVQP